MIGKTNQDLLQKCKKNVDQKKSKKICEETKKFLKPEKREKKDSKSRIFL